MTSQIYGVGKLLGDYIEPRELFHLLENESIIRYFDYEDIPFLYAKFSHYSYWYVNVEGLSSLCSSLCGNPSNVYLTFTQTITNRKSHEKDINKTDTNKDEQNRTISTKTYKLERNSTNKGDKMGQIPLKNYTIKSKKKRKEWEIKVTIPYEWKSKIDKIMEEKGYKTYSEFMRDILRSIIIKHE